MSHNRHTEAESRWPDTQRISQLISDPLRIRVLDECNEREMSPQSFHKEVGGAALSKVSQAFELLVQYDWLELTRTDTSDPDAVERFYRGTGTSLIGEETWSRFPDSTKALIAGRIFESLSSRVKEAMQAGTIFARTDAHLTWSALELDRQGWDTVVERVEAVFRSLTEEQEEANARMAESGEEPVSMTVALLAFESPKRTQRR